MLFRIGIHVSKSLQFKMKRREDVLKIIGPCCGIMDFEIESLDEENVVGKTPKHYTGFVI